jgi:hypothetical protein
MLNVVLGACFLGGDHHHLVQIQRPPPTLGETLLESCSQLGMLTQHLRCPLVQTRDKRLARSPDGFGDHLRELVDPTLSTKTKVESLVDLQYSLADVHATTPICARQHEW